MVKRAVTMTASAPASGKVGTAIAAASIASGVSGAASTATGVVAFRVFGPQTTAPSSCTGGGTAVGSAAVHGPGTYRSSRAFTPPAAGKYWWYATYTGDATDAPSHSACGASMAATAVTA